MVVEVVRVSSVLELEVTSAGAPGLYTVRVTASPGGEASSVTALDLSDLGRTLADVEQSLLASSVPSRRMLDRPESRVRDLGQLLFDALFAQPPVAAVYRASCAVATERGETLRMVLSLGAAELAAVPWESMFDQTAGSYVCRREPLVRCIPVAASSPPLSVQRPLRVLGLIASPRGFAALDVEKEKALLADALGQPIKTGTVELRWLEHTTWSGLQDVLMDGPWHVVHFIGHGYFDVRRDEGILAFEHDDGTLHSVIAAELVDLLHVAQPMPKLVVLNACESGTSGSDIFSSTSAALVRGGVSAVTAMQFGISDPAAIAFCRGLYSAIGRGWGIDEAVRSGRVAILGLIEGTLEWITPTLYLRGRETHLFAVADTSPLPPQREIEEWRVEAASAVESGDLGTALPFLDSVIAADPHDEAARQARAEAVLDPRRPGVGLDNEPSRDRPALYPDRMHDLRRAARATPWRYRPGSKELASISRAIGPEEAIVGCARLPLALTQVCVVVVSDRFLYFGSCQSDGLHWRNLWGDVPPQYRRSPEVIRIAIRAIPEQPYVADDSLVVPLGARQFVLSQWGRGNLDYIAKVTARVLS